jgi:hypothetical protein
METNDENEEGHAGSQALNGSVTSLGTQVPNGRSVLLSDQGALTEFFH